MYTTTIWILLHKTSSVFVVHTVELTAGKQEPGVFGSLESEPEPLEKKKPGAGDGTACKKSQEPEPKPLKNYPAHQPFDKIKSIRKLYFSYSSLGKIVSFYGQKTIILLVLYFL